MATTHRGGWLVHVAAVIAGMSGCSAGDDVLLDPVDCMPPPAPIYSCQPVAPGTADTCPGPTWEGTTFDEDKAFPVGCEVELPFCVAAYPKYVQTCTCSGGDLPATWTCPV